MNALMSRVCRLERGRGSVDGMVYYIAAPRGMASDDALARLGISIGQHDRVSLSTVPSAAPELIGAVPAYTPPGSLAEALQAIGRAEHGRWQVNVERHHGNH
jgi:hypothetical protein